MGKKGNVSYSIGAVRREGHRKPTVAGGDGIAYDASEGTTPHTDERKVVGIDTLPIDPISLATFAGLGNDRTKIVGAFNDTNKVVLSPANGSTKS